MIILFPTTIHYVRCFHRPAYRSPCPDSVHPPSNDKKRKGKKKQEMPVADAEAARGAKYSTTLSSFYSFLHQPSQSKKWNCLSHTYAEHISFIYRRPWYWQPARSRFLLSRACFISYAHTVRSFFFPIFYMCRMTSPMSIPRAEKRVVDWCVTVAVPMH